MPCSDFAVSPMYRDVWVGTRRCASIIRPDRGLYLSWEEPGTISFARANDSARQDEAGRLRIERIFQPFDDHNRVNCAPGARKTVTGKTRKSTPICSAYSRTNARRYIQYAHVLLNRTGSSGFGGLHNPTKLIRLSYFRVLSKYGYSIFLRFIVGQLFRFSALVHVGFCCD